MKKIFMLLFIAGLFYACNDFPEVPDTDEGEGTVYEYCFFDDGGYCLTGPFSSCPRGGQLSNSCEARVVEGMSYCVFDADSLCVIGGGDISECPENSRSQTFCPYPIPSDTTGEVLPDSVRHYCEFEDGEGNKICLPSPYANGFCGNAEKTETCYFADPTATTKTGLCNDEFYDKSTQYCLSDMISNKIKCGNEYIMPPNTAYYDFYNPGQRCIRRKDKEFTIETLCGPASLENTNWYDKETSFCDFGDYYGNYEIALKCNGKEYNYLAKEKKFIKNELEFSIWEQESCNNINEIIYVCDIYGHGELSDYGAKNIETGESQYEVEINSEFCFNATDSFTFNEGNKASGLYVVPLCGGSGGAPYDVTRQFCNEGEIEPIE